MSRRKFIAWGSLSISVLIASNWSKLISFFKKQEAEESMNSQNRQIFPLDFQWPTFEPFLFCVHHLDHYPKGNSMYGPDADLSQRQLGSDFQLQNGFRMYHGEIVPGFPVHPHRGFETITIVRKGYIDHSDSAGAAGRYGQGDVQWMTAGSGLQHSEMFPLLQKEETNTVELFQIWLNLPSHKKMTQPHFKMLWSEKIPKLQIAAGVEATIIAGNWESIYSPAPPPDSWAYDKNNEVQIWILKMNPQSKIQLPPASVGTNRTLYFFEGKQLLVNGFALTEKSGSTMSANKILTLTSGQTMVEVLVLQAKPIGERIVQHGPFVMNSENEIRQAFSDYNKTQFGGWPWPKAEMVHGPEIRRFAKYPDGKVETPT